MGEQRGYSKIKKEQIKQLNQLSAKRKRQDYINLCAQILHDHGCNMQTHLISTDGNIFPKPEWMLHPNKDEDSTLVMEVPK